MLKTDDESNRYVESAKAARDHGRRFSKINTNLVGPLILIEYLAERRKIMSSASRLLILTMAILAGSAATDFGPAAARPLSGGASLWLSCENGGHYRIRPLAVSSEGDLVTAHLISRGGRGIHVRLMPSGEGYRYAGRGIWFDGWRESVYLYLSKYRPIACTVVGEPERVKG